MRGCGDGSSGFEVYVVKEGGCTAREAHRTLFFPRLILRYSKKKNTINNHWYL